MKPRKRGKQAGTSYQKSLGSDLKPAGATEDSTHGKEETEFFGSVLHSGFIFLFYLKKDSIGK